MNLNTISLHQFRNYTSEKLLLHPVFNAFTGLNGMGKTNLLDAIYYLCLGKSFFSSSDKVTIMDGQKLFRIEGQFADNSIKQKVVVKTQINQRKEIEISGKKLDKISDHVGNFPCVMIAPLDIQMMMEGSEERRNFINNTIVQFDRAYLNDLLTYNKLLKQRNALLKSMQENRSFDHVLLESVTQGMFAPAIRIYEKRKALEEKMTDIFSDIYAEISGKKEVCKISYQSQLSEDNLENLTLKHLDKDRILARTTQGIHKDDLVFLMNGKTLRTHASQGQLKSFVLALKLTQYKILESVTSSKPILLLDDIFDKLDSERVSHLLDLISKKYFGQIFITDTQKDRIHDIFLQLNIDHSIFVVENGKVFNSFQ